jgi:VWFA-related protein
MYHVGRRLLPALLLLAVAHPTTAQDQPQSEQPVFRSSVDLVSMAAVVRDSKGKVVSTLLREDFVVIDGGRSRPILDLRSESVAPASVAILMDGSGSMNVGATAGRSLELARRVSAAILGSLDPKRDDAALFSFDTRLLVLQDFTRDTGKVRARLEEVGAWGQTSLFDAIAGAAGIVSKRTANRRAVIVLTDGDDTASAYSATEVSAIASAVDVPVYVFSFTPPVAVEDALGTGRAATLADLARWTGGDLLDASTPLAMNNAINRLIEELRHQYVIAFEASRDGGWRSVQLKTRKRGLTVRTRAWYLAGSSE